ncbi:MAG: restriction endonuclease subunit S, partial [Ruminococcus sp.]|nr:restriction endonuclease subunit S [Ruminococcus sp.]
MPYAFCEQIGKEIRDISDEIPFEIPDSWEWVRLGVISSLVTKGTTPRGGNVSYLDSGIGFLRAENVAGMDVLDTSKMNYIDEETHNGFLKRSILYENDLLITIAGTLGRTAIVRKHNLPLNANQAVSIIRLVNTNEFDLMYLICALNSPLIQKMLTEQKKITAIPNLTLEIISDCFIPIPPAEEQHRIVAKIEELLPYIERYGKAEEHLTALNTTFPEALKKSILQEAVQGKLVPQNPDDEPASVLLERIRAEKQALIKAGKIKKDKHESVIVTRDKIPYEIPDSWEWCKLSDLAILENGDRSSKYPVEADYVEIGIP